MSTERAELTQGLTQLEMSQADLDRAEQIATHLGYQQYAYTSTSDLWGLFCLPENPEHAALKPIGRARLFPPWRPGCIIKTRELGLLFVQDLEDLGVSASG